MSAPTDSDEDLTPSEQALSSHLQLLRALPPEPDRGLVTRVLDTLRWQRAVRRPVTAVAALAVAAIDGIRLLFATRTRR